MQIGSRFFEGPYNSVEQLRNAKGIYVILDNRKGNFIVIDVGMSEDIKERIQNHDRKTCWQRHSQGEICCAVSYMPHANDTSIRIVESEIRNQYDPPCGER